MLPALTERSGLKKALIITSLFWCCWHLPLLAFGDYMAGAPVWYKLPAFVLCIFPVGIIIGGLTYLSKSVWPAAFLHAAHNNYDQAVFGVITRGDDMMYYVSETGFLTIICAWVIAIIMIVKVKDIAAKEEIEIELIGLCTDICVVSNAVIAKAAAPEAEIIVDSKLTASFDPKLGEEVFDILKGIQVTVL